MFYAVMKVGSSRILFDGITHPPRKEDSMGKAIPGPASPQRTVTLAELEEKKRQAGVAMGQLADRINELDRLRKESFEAYTRAQGRIAAFVELIAGFPKPAPVLKAKKSGKPNPPAGRVLKEGKNPRNKKAKA